MVVGDGSPSAGSTGVAWKQLQEHASIFALDEVVICMVTTRPPKTIVKPTALGPVTNTDTKLLIYGLFQKGRVLAQDGIVYAKNGIDARKAYDELVAKWTPLAPAVVRA